MAKKCCLLLLTLSLSLCAFFNVSAHPGSLDSKGGHWNRSTGTYHFHTGENASSSFSGSSSSTYKSFVPPYEPPTINSFTVKSSAETATDTGSSLTPADSLYVLVILLLFFSAIVYIIAMIIKMYEDTRYESLLSKCYTHPFISWHIAYFIVFSLVCFCSVIGYSETFSRQYTLEYTLENLNFSALIAVLSTAGISFVVLIFLYSADAIKDKKISKKGCYITKTPTSTSQELPKHQSSKADDHPFRPFFYLYSFYILAILFSVAFTEYIFIEKIKLFVDLALLYSIGYIMIWVSLLVPTIIMIPVIDKIKEIKNIEKALVCRNCGFHNSTSSYVCSKCGIDFINYDTSIDRKNMMEICRIPDINSIDSEYCTKLIDAGIYSFFVYDISKYSGKCLLRYNCQSGEVVYFGKCYEFNCVYKGYLFSANKHSDARKEHRVIARHVVSGKEETYFWFSPGTIWNGGTYCQDSVNQLYIDNDALIIEVHRTKTFDFPKEYSKYTLSKYNANTDYIITVTYIDGKFNVEKTFPNLINDL